MEKILIILILITGAYLLGVSDKKDTAKEIKKLLEENKALKDENNFLKGINNGKYRK